MRAMPYGPARARPPASAGERLDQALRFLLLRSGALRQDFLEDVARTIRVTHVHVGAGEIELGADLTHRHRLEIRQGQVLGREALGRGESRVRYGRGTHVEVEPAVGLVRAGRGADIEVHATVYGMGTGGVAHVDVEVRAPQGAHACGRRNIWQRRAGLRERGLELILVELPGTGRLAGLFLGAAVGLFHHAARL